MYKKQISIFVVSTQLLIHKTYLYHNYLLFFELYYDIIIKFIIIIIIIKNKTNILLNK